MINIGRYHLRSLLLILAIVYSTVLFGKEGKPFATQYYRSITIDHTKVPNTTQTDFPVLINGTFAYLKTVANGGKVQNSNGYDILFSSDAAGATLLNWEIEKYDATTGELIAWVKTDLSATTDKVIYIRYGDNTISSFQGNASSVWSNSFAGVYHLKNNSGVSGADATSNGNNGTVSSASSTTGMIGSGGSFASGANISFNSLFGNAASVTLSSWVNLTAVGTTGSEVISLGDHISLRVDQSTFSNGVSGVYYTGSAWPQINGGSLILNTGWHHVAFSVTASNQKLFLDGVQVASATNSSAVSYSGLSSGTKIGIHGAGQTYFNFGGIIDEARVSNAIRTADWLKTEFNNQSSPSTFYAVGNETSSGNQLPTSNAGSDQSITLPTSSVTLSGSGADPDGTIASYAWTQVSGTTATISSASSASTTITGLNTAGTRVFRLTVTDNSGATATDDVSVTVNAAPPPTVNAGSDQTITLPTSQVTLTGTATANNGGSISSYAWTLQSGTGGTITSPSSASTTVTGLTSGTRTYRLTVTDNTGGTSYDDVIVSVNASGGSSQWTTAGTLIHYTAGNVAIGTSTVNSSYKLTVDGTIAARKIKVTSSSNWADYVFAPDYKLPTLAEVEAFIKKHQRLPDIPSANEVSKNGFDVADQQALLLKKIEELTLYIIGQEKRIKDLESKLKSNKQ